jgi:hypothetical protein
MPMLHRAIAALALCVAPATARATDPKLDVHTCAALRLEQIKFRQSGILDDMSKGPEWAKANLSADRLREIEHYLALDEQVKFGCRDAKLSPEAEKASEAAARIEMNSDADPTAPAVFDPPKPGTATKPEGKKRTAHKKTKSADPKPQSLDQSLKGTTSDVSDQATVPPVPAEGTPSPPPASAAGAPATPSMPQFGFGETAVSPRP